MTDGNDAPECDTTDRHTPPPSGSRLRLEAVWWPGTYLLYHRGIEYFRPGEEPPWLEDCIRECGWEIRTDGSPQGTPLTCYVDEAVLVPVLRIKSVERRVTL